MLGRHRLFSNNKGAKSPIREGSEAEPGAGQWTVPNQPLTVCLQLRKILAWDHVLPPNPHFFREGFMYPRLASNLLCS